MKPLNQAIAVISILIGLILCPAFALAADVVILPEQKSVIANAEFVTDITINTGGESINAFSGTITFPTDLITLKEVRLGSSIINYWIDKPLLNETEITFAGMTPGGFTGDHGLLFSLIFTATHEGQGTIKINNPEFLKNDGFGSAANLAVGHSAITILPPDQRRSIKIPPIPDEQPPAAFAPIIDRSPALHNNAWVIFFSTQDKESGINYYEVQEKTNGLPTFFTPWQRVESPYLLKDQSVSNGLNIRAVDLAGNIRTVHVPALFPEAWYLNLTNWFILVGIAVILVALKQIIWRIR